MKVTKRRTKVKCEFCDTVIGYKCPPTIQGFSYLFEGNENYGGYKQADIGYGNGNYQVCKTCKTKIIE